MSKTKTANKVSEKPEAAPDAEEETANVVSVTDSTPTFPLKGNAAAEFMEGKFASIGQLDDKVSYYAECGVVYRFEQDPCTVSIEHDEGVRERELNRNAMTPADFEEYEKSHALSSPAAQGATTPTTFTLEDGSVVTYDEDNDVWRRAEPYVVTPDGIHPDGSYDSSRDVAANERMVAWEREQGYHHCPEAVLAVLGASQRGKATRVGDLPNIVNSLDGEYQAVKVEGGIELTFVPDSHRPDAARHRLVQLREQLRHAVRKVASVTQIADGTPKTSPQISEGLRRSVERAQDELGVLESERDRILAATPELRKETLLQQALHLEQGAEKLDKKALEEDESARKWREKGLNPYTEEQVDEMKRANAENEAFVPPDDRNEGQAAQCEAQAEESRRQARAKRGEAEGLKDEARDLPGVPEKQVTLIPNGSVVGFAL